MRCRRHRSHLLVPKARQDNSCGQRSPFLLSSGHDDRDHRTRAERTKAKRLGRLDHCSRRRRDLPDPARTCERCSGRLAVVFRDRLSAGVLDDDRRQGRHLRHHFCGDRHDPRDQRIACVAAGPACAGTGDRRGDFEAGGVCDAARPAGVHARSTDPAAACRAGCDRARSAGRRDGSRQLGRVPAVRLSGAVWPERSAVRQGHRLLSLLPSRLCRPQELDAADARLELARSPERSIGCTATSNSTSSAGRSRRRAIAHGSALLGLFFAVKAWSYGLDRYLLLYGDNGVVVGASYTDIHIALPVLWLLVGLSIIAALACWANLRVRTYKLPVAGGGAGLWQLLRAGSGVVPGAVSARVRETERAAAGEALHPAQHRPHPTGLQSPSDHGQTLPGRTEVSPSRRSRPTRRPLTISGCGTGSR